MKDNASDISGTKTSGVRKLFDLFQSRRHKLPRIRLHLVGHSAGAFVHTFLAPRAVEAGFEIGTVSPIAPAVRVDDFAKHPGPVIAKKNMSTLVVHLTDGAEQSDPSCSPYGRSLLYLVSRAFETLNDTPILGMEKNLVPAVVGHEWGSNVRRLAAQGSAFRPGDRFDHRNDTWRIGRRFRRPGSGDSAYQGR